MEQRRAGFASVGSAGLREFPELQGFDLFEVDLYVRTIGFS